MGDVDPTLVGVGESQSETPSFVYCNTHSVEDTDRWAVWVGRHTLEKISRVP